MEEIVKTDDQPMFGEWKTFIDIFLAKNQELNLSFTWLDSVRKKTEAVADMANKLNLHNVHMVWGRAEEHEWRYDVLTARAMSYIDNLLLRCNHIVKKWWYFVLYKMYSEEEERHLNQLCGTYKLAIEKKHIYTLFPWDIQRVIYVFFFYR